MIFYNIFFEKDVSCRAQLCDVEIENVDNCEILSTIMSFHKTRNLVDLCNYRL